MDPTIVLGVLAGAGVLTIMSSLRVLYEYQRGVVFRLGKLTRPGGREWSSSSPSHRADETGWISGSWPWTSPPRTPSPGTMSPCG